MNRRSAATVFIGLLASILFAAYTYQYSTTARAAKPQTAPGTRSLPVLPPRVVPGMGTAVNTGPPFGRMTLVDEVNCATEAPIAQGPNGASQTRTVLGRACRVLPPTASATYFAYRIGQNKNLQPGRAYVLSVEFPDDAPRATFILNRGSETNRGFSTGAALGDALFGYTNNNAESLQIPHTQKWQTWQSLFFLHDRFPALNQPRDNAVRPDLPANGFLVIIAQLSRDDDPISQGAAVGRIRLFTVPNAEELSGTLPFPPGGLPRRHLFWREEMSDGVIGSPKPEERGVLRDRDWFEYKGRLARFLNMDTLSKDLLEFGHNQGWDSGPNNDWYVNPPFTQRWEEIVQVAAKHHLSLLPYYEYAGSTGAKGLGPQKRAVPLKGSGPYTHIEWSERFNVDITDPETLSDATRLLDATITRYKAKSNFLGAWFRPRPSHMPVSFSDAALARFAKEANGSKSVSRETLKNDAGMLTRYRAWWMKKRRDFVSALARHLEANVSKNAFVLLTPDASEPGRSLFAPTTELVTDDVQAWTPLLEQARPGGKIVKPVLLSDVIGQNRHFAALTGSRPTWGDWEWQNSDPEADPANYTASPQDGAALLTFSMNRAYTVGSAAAMNSFRTPSGLAIVYHYPLNENRMHPDLGYFVSDMEHWGPYSLLAEARAMASGDPRLIGYLASSSWSRGFPQFARPFNAAFLSLPALPSRVVENAVSGGNREIVVRAIATPKNGTYYAVVNTGLTTKPGVMLRLPVPKAGRVFDAATGAGIPLDKSGMVKLGTLGPCELRALHAGF